MTSYGYVFARRRPSPYSENRSATIAGRQADVLRRFFFRTAQVGAQQSGAGGAEPVTGLPCERMRSSYVKLVNPYPLGGFLGPSYLKNAFLPYSALFESYARLRGS